MTQSGSKEYPGTPRWVKAVGALALVLVIVFAMLHLTGRGFRRHGAGAHEAGAAGAH